MRRRAAGVVPLLAFALSLGARGACFMDMPRTDGEAPHGCCGDGLRAAAPPCCRDSVGREAPGTASPRAAAMSLAPSFVALVPTGPASCRPLLSCGSPIAGHDPPPGILRV
jgi:hypothetical protein